MIELNKDEAIVTLLEEGMSIRAIARRLGISPIAVARKIWRVTLQKHGLPPSIRTDNSLDRSDDSPAAEGMTESTDP